MKDLHIVVTGNPFVGDPLKVLGLFDDLQDARFISDEILKQKYGARNLLLDEVNCFVDYDEIDKNKNYFTLALGNPYRGFSYFGLYENEQQIDKELLKIGNIITIMGYDEIYDNYQINIGVSLQINKLKDALKLTSEQETELNKNKLPSLTPEQSHLLKDPIVHEKFYQSYSSIYPQSNGVLIDEDDEDTFVGKQESSETQLNENTNTLDIGRGNLTTDVFLDGVKHTVKLQQLQQNSAPQIESTNNNSSNEEQQSERGNTSFLIHVDNFGYIQSAPTAENNNINKITEQTNISAIEEPVATSIVNNTNEKMYVISRLSDLTSDQTMIEYIYGLFLTETEVNEVLDKLSKITTDVFHKYVIELIDGSTQLTESIINSEHKCSALIKNTNSEMCLKGVFETPKELRDYLENNKENLIYSKRIMIRNKNELFE